MTAYAVNRKTKEHRIAKPGESWAHPWQLLSADSDGWVEWFGGECPLPDGDLCTYKMRGGCGSTDEAGDIEWRHIGMPTDVVAYKPILDADTKPGIDVTRLVSERQSPAWDGEGLPPEGCECECREVAYGAKGNFTRCRTVHKTTKGVILVEFEHGDFGYGVAPGDFRPIRSEEDKAVEEMVHDLNGAGCRGLSMKHIARKLYEIGYRKQ